MGTTTYLGLCSPCTSASALDKISERLEQSPSFCHTLTTLAVAIISTVGALAAGLAVFTPFIRAGYTLSSLENPAMAAGALSLLVLGIGGVTPFVFRVTIFALYGYPEPKGGIPAGISNGGTSNDVEADPLLDDLNESGSGRGSPPPKTPPLVEVAEDTEPKSLPSRQKSEPSSLPPPKDQRARRGQRRRPVPIQPPPPRKSSSEDEEPPIASPQHTPEENAMASSPPTLADLLGYYCRLERGVTRECEGYKLECLSTGGYIRVSKGGRLHYEINFNENGEISYYKISQKNETYFLQNDGRVAFADNDGNRETRQGPIKIDSKLERLLMKLPIPTAEELRK